jgi:large subunit ribosomal protein L9
MAMEVLLRRSIEGVGAVGEVVRVRNGYARNYLLPRGLAALVNAESLKLVDKDRAAEAIREAEEAKQRAEVAQRLKDVTVTVEARAGEDGHLYGSVGPRQVIEALARQGFHFQDRQVRFDLVRELGEYEVPIHLTREHVVPIKLWVVQDAIEAADQAERAAAQGAPAPAPEGEAQAAETPTA